MTRPFTRILVPTDFSETSDAALAYAKALATAFSASLHLVHVFEDPFTAGTLASEVYAPIPPDLRAQVLADLRQRLDERMPQGVGTSEILTGITAKVLVDYAREQQVDLIVMGTHGRGGMAHLLLGSVAERVVRTAPCPVLTVREAVVKAPAAEQVGTLSPAPAQ
jgi:nucleotide-binding universal stress UspA family protein